MEAAWGGGEERGCGKFKKKEKELPFPMAPPFSLYVCTYLFTYLNEYFLLHEGLERLFLSYSRPGGEAPSVPERRLGSGVRAVGSALRALSAPRLDLSSVGNRRVKKCGVDGWTGLASTWTAQRPSINQTCSPPFFFLPLIFVQYVGFFSPNDVT